MSPKLADGDVVAVDPEVSPLDNDYVLAEIVGEFVIRLFIRVDDDGWLIPIHPANASMKTPQSEAKLIGVAVALLPPIKFFLRENAAKAHQIGEGA